MRILLVGFKNWIGGWTEPTFSALKGMGHTVNLLYYRDEALSRKQRTFGRLRRVSLSPIHKLISKLDAAQQVWINQRLLNTVQDSVPDLVFVLKGETIAPETLKAIKRENVLLATWWVDNPFVFDEAIKGYPSYDAFFVFDTGYISKLKRLGIPHVELLLNAYDPAVYYPAPLTQSELELYKCDVAFLGTYYPLREEMFKGLGHNKDVAIWGPGGWTKFPAARKYVDINKAFRGLMLAAPQAAKLYNAATICLNIHHRHQTTFDGFNLRAFEILACGAFELSDHRPGFDLIFTANQEMVYYNSFDEIGDIVEYYLSHPDERKEIAWQGYQRVIKEHSFQRRMEKVVAWATNQLR